MQFTPWEGLFPRTWQGMQGIAGEAYVPGSLSYERLSAKNYLQEGMPPLFLAEGQEDHVGTALVSRKLAEECQAKHLPVEWKSYPLAGPSFLSVLDWKPAQMLLEDLFRFFEKQAGEDGRVPKVAFPSPEGVYGVYLDSPAQSYRGVDIYLPPKGMKIHPTALFLVHGGGWRAGDRSKLGEIAAAFAKRGILTASAGYRLRAHDAFEQLADLRRAYDAFVGELKRLGRPLRIVVYGESAGAHLVSLLAATQPGGCGEKCHLTHPWVRPAAMILQSAPTQFIPWKDIAPGIWISMEDIAGAPYARDPERYTRLSLNHWIGKDTPPVFFAEAEYESVFPVEMTRALAEELKRLGVPAQTKRYPLAEHGFFYTLKERPIQREFFEDIVKYLEKVIQ